MTALIIGVVAGIVASIVAVLSAYFFRRQTNQYKAVQHELQQARSLLADIDAPSREAGTDRRDEAAVSFGPSLVPDVPEELLAACLDREAILCTGNGFAAIASVPTVRELLGRMLDQLVDEEPSRWRDLRSQLATIEPSLSADVLASRLDRDQIIRLLTTALPSSTSSPLLQELAQIPFDGVVTSNWDLSFENAFSNRAPLHIGPKSTDLAPILRGERFFIFKLYGDIQHPDEFIFELRMSRPIGSMSPELARFWRSLFATRTVLFLGTSPTEIADIMNLTDISSPAEHAHFALVPSTHGEALESERLLTAFNIRLLPYGASPGHPEVKEFVHSLGAKISEQRQTVRPKQRAQTVDEVILHGIGPFTDLRLELGRSWNVLLGNNGCGKSTILRAIALGLCGDDVRVQQFAPSLLRPDSATGTIELRVGKTNYRTVLFRDGNRVRIDSGQITPVQGGQWLVLGFPPLRGVSTHNPSGPSEMRSPDPQVDDLLPLVDPIGLDDRLSGLKQWLVNISVASRLRDDYRSVDNSRLRNMFFEVMRRLLPSTPFTFEGVNTETWDVLVRTEDGVIPIDRLSQGMSSALSWIGTVLQRLYDVYRDDVNPQDSKALILIDEIDVHLHPEAQARIVPVLRDMFPQLQIVATTHSPFIVGNLRPDELYHLRRQPGLGVTAERIKMSHRGWRADQILTGPAFDMYSTRDEATKQLMKEYTDLLGTREPTKEQRDRLQGLSHQLEGIVPSYAETETARQAEQLVEEWLYERIGDLSSAEQANVLAEVRMYLARLHSEGS